jgi:glutamine synthetase
MFSSFGELKHYVETEGVETLDFKVTQLSGSWRHLSVPARALSEKLFSCGFGFDGSNYGYTTIEASDMVFIPDLRSAFVDPFWSRKTLGFLGTVHEILPDGFRPYGGDSREILDRALAALRATGRADSFHVGPEFEFYIFDSVSYRNELNRSGFEIDAVQAEWRSDDDDGQGLAVRRKGGYHLEAPSDINRDLRADMAAAIDGLGIPVKYHHHEVGGPGQHEIETAMGEAKFLADGAMLIKHFVRNIAVERGCTATFMPKPFYGEAGSGMHVHMQLFKDGESVFAGPETNYGGLSDLALNFMGGILAHAPALSAVASPSTNSYKRLVRGYEAPIGVAFATSNRSAIIRIPGYAKAPEDRRFEFRSSDATANPYILFAALLQAGLDGVRRSIDPAKSGFGPVETDIYHADTEKMGLRLLPQSLDEALDELEKDHGFLLEGGVFPESFITNWVTLKRKEAKEVNDIPTPKEYELYYSC